MTEEKNELHPVQALFGEDWQKLSFNERVAAIACYKIGNKEKNKIRRLIKGLDWMLYENCRSMIDVAEQYIDEGGLFDNPIIAKFFDVDSFADEWAKKSENCEVVYSDSDGNFSGWVVFGNFLP